MKFIVALALFVYTAAAAQDAPPATQACPATVDGGMAGRNSSTVYLLRVKNESNKKITAVEVEVYRFDMFGEILSRQPEHLIAHDIRHLNGLHSVPPGKKSDWARWDLLLYPAYHQTVTRLTKVMFDGGEVWTNHDPTACIQNEHNLAIN